MAETTVKQKVCKACGVDIRPNSMFCYNCGSSITADQNGGGEVSDVWLRESIAEEDKTETVEKIEKTEESEKSETEISEPIHLNPSKNEPTNDATEEPELKSAAEMRRKAKSYQQKKVEIVWEEAENSSNIKLVLATILLLGFAIAVVATAFYLK